MHKFRPHYFEFTKLTPPTHPATTKSFNAIINRLSTEGAHHEVIATYAQMLRAYTLPDAYSFPSLLKACTSLNLFSHGLSVHQLTIISGLTSDPYISSSLLNFYAKFGYTQIAHQIFDSMPVKNVVPWTAIISCYSREGNIDMAFSMLNAMRNQEIQATSVTVLGVLSGVSLFAHVRCLHACAICCGFMGNLAVVNSLLNVYGRSNRVEDSRVLFELMDHRDVISWNSFISGYAQVGNLREILELLMRMRMEGIEPDKQTFGSVVSAISTHSNIELGRLIHGQILTSGFKCDSNIETSLIVMYLKCKKLTDAFLVFEKSTYKSDVILCTAMISGLVQNNSADKALNVFHFMLNLGVLPSTATIAAALSACAQLGCFNKGRSIHSFILRQHVVVDIAVNNALMTMYSKCGCLKQSLSIFRRMSERDVVSWNSIVAGHAQNGYLSKALFYFSEMRKTLRKPDSITFITLLQSCASTGALHPGKWVHNFVTKSSMSPSIVVDTALVDMYSKCGELDTAKKCFQRMPHKDLVSWSTIISGHGSHGEGEIALNMFSKFLQSGIKPNDAIFLSVLSTCNHNGLILPGLDLFESMVRDFGIKPKLEHTACVVDLLSRAGMVEEAYKFLNKMFKKPTVDVLGILLDACRIRGNKELGEIIAKDILLLKPVSAENYVQVAHSYAAMSQWEAVGQAWIRMRSLGLKKSPGWSSIEQNGNITTFFSDDSSHPRYEELVFVLKCLGKEMRDYENWKAS